MYNKYSVNKYISPVIMDKYYTYNIYNVNKIDYLEELTNFIYI
jgi:hypothetical protein